MQANRLNLWCNNMGTVIKDLDTLLLKSFKTNEVVKKINLTNLTKPGDNYGSLMLKLDVVVLNKENNEEKTLNLVAKMLPESQLFREIFKIQTTCTKEIAFYDLILPTLQTFQMEIGAKIFDSFAKCYGTRKNLKNSDVIDEDAVMLLENLQIKGYSHVDRNIGFDIDTTILLLRDSARMHGSFLALKMKRPEKFKNNVRPYCQDYEPVGDEAFRIFFRKVYKEITNEDEVCLKYASKIKFWGDRVRKPPREPFATFIHTDMWTNNTMQIYKNGKAVTNKFIDFQLFTYGSPAADVFFLLWSSVQKAVLEKYLDFLLELYHDELIETLKNHDCDTREFTFQAFSEELRLEAEYEFSHSIHFLFIVSIVKDHDTLFGNAAEVLKNVPKYFKEKVSFMVRECEKRGWLY